MAIFCHIAGVLFPVIIVNLPEIYEAEKAALLGFTELSGTSDCK